MKSLEKITGVLLLCAIVSCKKNELEVSSQPETTDNTVTTEQHLNIENDWSAPTQWNKADQPSHTVYYTTIKAPGISTDDANKSFVRIFKKDNGGKMISKALPFEETNGSQKSYWYYEISEGNIVVSVDVYGARSNPLPNSSFKYIVLDEADIQAMQQKGIGKKDLKRLSYDELNNLR